MKPVPQATSSVRFGGRAAIQRSSCCALLVPAGTVACRRTGRGRATSRRTRGPARGSRPSPLALGYATCCRSSRCRTSPKDATARRSTRSARRWRARARASGRPRRRRPQPLGVHAGRRGGGAGRRRSSPGVACARERIDLRRHEGAHPRIGAADVVPLVPIGPRTWSGRGRPRCEVAGPDRRARPAGVPLRRVPGAAPRSSGAAARRSSSARIDVGEVAPDFGPPTARPRGGRGPRRGPPAAGRVQRRTSRTDDVEVARAIAAIVRETGRRLPRRSGARSRPPARRVSFR